MAAGSEPATLPHFAARFESKPLLRHLLTFGFAAALLAWTAYLGYRTLGVSTLGQKVLADDAAHYGEILTRLPAGLGFLGVCLLFAASATGYGSLALRPLRMPWADGAERWFFAGAAGLAAWSFATIALGFAGLLQVRVFAPLIGFGDLALAVEVMLAIRSQGLPRLGRPSALTVLLLVAIALTAYTDLLFALVPVVQFDARWYHLGVPKHFVELGRIYDIVRVTHLGSAALTPYEEMLYTAILVVSDQIAAKLLNWVLALATVALMAYFARVHLGSTKAGLLGGLIFLSTPQLAWSTATADNDLPMPFLTLLALHAFLRWRRSDDWRWLLLASFGAGYSIGVKIHGAFTAAALLLGGLWVKLRERRQRPASLGRPLLAGLIAGVVACLPWNFYAYKLTGNPVFPYLLPSPYWGPGVADTFKSFIHSYGADQSALGLLRLPWWLVVHGQYYRGFLGLVYGALAPGALLVLLERGQVGFTLRLAAILTALWTLGWFATALLDMRYLEGVLPVVALLLAAGVFAPGAPGTLPGAAVVRWTLLGVAVAGVVLDNQFVVPLATHATDVNVDGRAYANWQYLYEGRPENQVFINHEVDWLNANLDPRRDKVYDGVILQSAYLYCDIELFNGWGYDSPSALHEWQLTDPDALDHLRAEHITYVILFNFGSPEVLASALGPHLQQVAVIDDIQTFRVVYGGG